MLQRRAKITVVDVIIKLALGTKIAAHAYS
jgi:hypothetical protein